MQSISRYTKAKIEAMELPSGKEIQQSRIAELQQSLLEQCNTAPSEAAVALAQSLLETDSDPATLLAVLLQNQIAAVTANIPQIEIPKPVRRNKPRASGAQMVKVHINAGKKDRMAPNFILGALVDATGLTGRDFGKIDIFDQYTTVEIPETEKEFVLDSMKNEKINGHRVTVKLHETTSGGRYGNNRNRSFQRQGSVNSRRTPNQRNRYESEFNRKKRKG